MSLNLNHILDEQKRISLFSEPEKKKRISKSVIKSHFSYCLARWTFGFRKFNKLMDGIHKKITKYSVWWYDDAGSTFKEVLQLSKTVSVHHKNM